MSTPPWTTLSKKYTFRYKICSINHILPPQLLFAAIICAKFGQNSVPSTHCDRLFQKIMSMLPIVAPMSTTGRSRATYWRVNRLNQEHPSPSVRDMKCHPPPPGPGLLLSIVFCPEFSKFGHSVWVILDWCSHTNPHGKNLLKYYDCSL